MNERKENIETFNSKEQHHGYQELYDSGSGIYLRAVIKYDNYVGYQEWHGYGKATRFHIR